MKRLFLIVLTLTLIASCVYSQSSSNGRAKQELSPHAFGSIVEGGNALVLTENKDRFSFEVSLINDNLNLEIYNITFHLSDGSFEGTIQEYASGNFENIVYIVRIWEESEVGYRVYATSEGDSDAEAKKTVDTVLKMYPMIYVIACEDNESGLPVVTKVDYFSTGAILKQSYAGWLIEKYDVVPENAETLYDYIKQ